MEAAGQLMAEAKLCSRPMVFGDGVGDNGTHGAKFFRIGWPLQATLAMPPLMKLRPIGQGLIGFLEPPLATSVSLDAPEATSLVLNDKSLLPLR